MLLSLSIYLLADASLKKLMLCTNLGNIDISNECMIQKAIHQAEKSSILPFLLWPPHSGCRRYSCNRLLHGRWPTSLLISGTKTYISRKVDALDQCLRAHAHGRAEERVHYIEGTPDELAS